MECSWNHEYFGSLARKGKPEGLHVNFARDPKYSWFHEHSKNWIHFLIDFIYVRKDETPLHAYRSARLKPSAYTHAQLPRWEIRLKFVLEPSSIFVLCVCEQLSLRQVCVAHTYERPQALWIEWMCTRKAIFIHACSVTSWKISLKFLSGCARSEGYATCTCDKLQLSWNGWFG